MDLTDSRTLALLYMASEWAVRLVMLVIIPLRRSPEAAKSWLLLTLFLPWVGLALYLVIGRPRFPRWREELARRVGTLFRPVAERLTAQIARRPALPPELAEAGRLATNLGHLQITNGNDAQLLVEYEALFTRLVADIDAAQNHVHLLFYIFADDPSTAPVIEALGRAVQRGVRCRVLVDALGSKKLLPTVRPRLLAAGVEVHAVLPLGWFRRRATRVDLRNHRKIAVIDGRVGYTGSQNLVEPTFKPGIVYEELMVRVTGPVVLQLQFVFAADWFLETEEVLDGEEVFPEPKLTGDLLSQVLPSGPDYPTENNQRFIVALLHRARRRVVITTPYFIPDDALLQALQTAVLRGVEVSVIVSKARDQVLVCLGQQSYYEQLLEAGVRIYLYKEHFLHAKHITFDDIAFIGSSNMDIRSFQLNSEISLLFYDPRVASWLQTEQERYMARSEHLTLEVWNERGQVATFAQNMARLLSPLL